MILPDYAIRDWAEHGGLSPFDPACINPASVDLRWSGRVRVASPVGWGEVRDFDGYTLIPGVLYLLNTLEVVTMADDLAGVLALKSSMGRQGLEHLHAGFVDPGFTGTLTLEMEVRAPWPILLARGQRIMQLILERMEDIPDAPYYLTGRYCGQNEPQPARR